MDIEKINLAILCGGWSDESAYTAHKEVEEAAIINKFNYKVISVNNPNWIIELKEFNTNVAFITNQGNFGEDGKIQALLDILDIKYVGSGTLPSAIGMNKYFFKKFLETINIKTPKYLLNTPSINFETIVEKIGTPFILKPVSNGASVGVLLISNSNNFDNKVNNMENEYGDIMFEEYIAHPKIEIGAGILEIKGVASNIQPCLIKYKSDFFSNELKFSGDNVIESYNVDDSLTQKASQLALKIHEELGCSGLSRTDFIVDSKKNIFVLEINTLPGLMDNSIFPMECLNSGIDYPNMIRILIESAFRKKKYEVPKKILKGDTLCI